MASEKSKKQSKQNKSGKKSRAKKISGRKAISVADAQPASMDAATKPAVQAKAQEVADRATKPVPAPKPPAQSDAMPTKAALSTASKDKVSSVTNGGSADKAASVSNHAQKTTATSPKTASSGKADPPSVSTFATGKAQHGQMPGSAIKPQTSVALDQGLAHSFFGHALTALSLAILTMIAFIIVQFQGETGLEAVTLVSGTSGSGYIPSAELGSSPLLNWALFLDTLFPILYGAGLICLIAGYTQKGHRAVFGALYVLVGAAVLADFVENATVVTAVQSGEVAGLSAAAWITSIKYGLLAVAAFVTSAVIVDTGPLARTTSAVLRFAFPVSIAFLVSGIAPEAGRVLAGLVFLASLILLALLARQNRDLLEQ